MTARNLCCIVAWLLACCFPLMVTLCGAQHISAGHVEFGNHTIEIHLLNSRGSAANLSARVVILSASGLQLAEAYSDHQQGVAEFEGFRDGDFQVRITASSIETITLSFSIGATEATHREYVRIEPKKDSTDSNLSPDGDDTISADDLSVPENAREEFARAMEAHAKGDDKSAQFRLEHAIELYPAYAKAHNNLGVLYQKAGLREKAFAEYSRAVEVAPNFSSAYVNLAKLSMTAGNFAQAEGLLRRALMTNTAALNAMVLLCSTQFARREYIDSLATAQKVHRLTQDGRYADVHLVAAEIFITENKPREAANEYQFFVKERPQDPRLPKIKSLISQLTIQ